MRRDAGHHAECHCGKGFCVFNNVAIAAAVAKKECGVERILIVDWFLVNRPFLFFSFGPEDGGGGGGPKGAI
jgi:hypothetical protein